jgi:O-antigen ligase
LVARNQDVMLLEIRNTLQLDSRERGMGSGFTGRVDAWGEAVKVFQTYPAFGVGFRMQDRYIEFSGLHSAHNGYLGLLVELGVSGLSLFLVWLGIRTVGLLKHARREDEFAILGLSLWGGYAFQAFFDNHLISAGNATSLIMLVLLLKPSQLAYSRRRSFEGVRLVRGGPAGRPSPIGAACGPR